MNAFRFALASLLLLLLSIPRAHADDEPATKSEPKSAATETAQPIVSSELEDMIRMALELNPQIVRAAVEVRAAQADLNQAVIDVTQKLTDLHQNRRDLANKLKEIDASIQEASTGDSAAGKHQLELLRRQELEFQERIARLDAEIRGTLGIVSAGATALDGTSGLVVIHSGADPDVAVSFTAPRPPQAPQPPAPPRLAPIPANAPYMAEPKIPEPIAKALEAKVQIDVEGMPLDEIVSTLQKATDGDLVFVVDREAREDTRPVTLSLPREVTIREAMEILGDIAEISFIVRDYGIWITERTEPERVPGFIVIPDYRRPAGRPLGGGSK